MDDIIAVEEGKNNDGKLRHVSWKNRQAAPSRGGLVYLLSSVVGGQCVSGAGACNRTTAPFSAGSYALTLRV